MTTHATLPLRIAHLIESDGPGGAEQVVADLAKGFQAAGARSVVFLPERGEGWLGRQLAGSGAAIEHFHIERPFSPACARRIASAFRTHHIDVAHSHEFSMAIYGAWASRLAGIPHVITMHGGRYYADRIRRRLALGVAVALSDRTVAVSRLLADDLRRQLHVPASLISIVPNGVRRVRASKATLRAELQLGPSDRLLVSIGNLYPVKGHEHLVEALARLAADHPTLHVAIAGRGALADALTARASALGVADRLHLLGLRSDVPAVLAAADIFVMPSLSEGLPLALLEAMFAGCPIVATDVGEVGRALAQGWAGVLVPPADPRALATAIDALLRDAERSRALGDRAAARAVAEYDVSRMLRRYAAIYQGLATSRRRVVQPPRIQHVAGL